MSNLFQCPLFRGLTPAETETLLDGQYSVKTYAPGEIIALQASRYESLFIVSEGLVRGEMTDTLGRNAVIEEIPAPRAVAPAFLYATENRLPVTITAIDKTEMTIIHRQHFTLMMQKEARLLINYLQSMADRSCFLSEKLHMQRFGSIKSKLARYLLELSQKQQADSFVMPHTQQELADMFGVTRPALARCIGQLEKDELIEAKGKTVNILARQRLMGL
ncbi:MAG: Crp/Fnr family transcriptional regulator [Bacteroidota bacterium]|nr:Crp/Fnr family transcriptional regulator [Bacteroidota bacterium]